MKNLTKNIKNKFLGKELSIYKAGGSMEQKKEQAKWLKSKNVNLSKDKKRILIFTESGEAISINVALAIHVIKGVGNVSGK